MAKWKNQYTPIENINGGNEYEIGDVPSPTMFNTAVENSNYAAQLGVNQPNNTEANNVGVPSVTIEQTADGKNRFKFSNLKGDSGNPSGNILQELGDSTTDTLSQKVVTENLNNKLDKTQCNLQFNQLLSESYEFLPVYAKDFSYINKEYTFTPTQKYGRIELAHGFNTIVGHKYYYGFNILAPYGDIALYMNDGTSQQGAFVSHSLVGQYQFTSAIFTPKRDYITFKVQDNNGSNWKPIKCKNIIIVDLTEMFGAGNEPETVAEVQKYIPTGTYYPYQLSNAELTDCKLDKTQCNLQFNQLWKSSQVETRIDVDGLDMGHDGEFAFCRGTNRYDARPEVWRAGAISLNVNHKYYIDIVFNKNIGSVSSRINHDSLFMPCFISNHDQVTYYLFIDPSIYVDVEYQINLIDLTEMFGAGNEPQFIGEVQEYLGKNKFYPYGENSVKKYAEKIDIGIVKRELNSLSMCPSADAIDNIYTLDGNPFIDYEAPANGYVMIWFKPANGSSKGYSLGLLTGKQGHGLLYNDFNVGFGGDCHSYIPVVKGMIARFYYGGNISNITNFKTKFTYAEEV